MVFYVPTHFEKDDYAPSWTGNYKYDTISIRGIFDSMEKAEAEANNKNWRYNNNYTILTFSIEDEEEDDEEEDDEEEEDEKEESINFNIDYSDKTPFLSIEINGKYSLNNVIDEAYSAVYDPKQNLGVTDY